LGRVVKGWGVGRSKPAGNPPSSEYTYQVSADAPVAVLSRGLLPNGGYRTTIELFDGLLRPRQTQLPAPGGGRLLTDSFYDSRGLPYKSNGTYYNSAAPGTAIHDVTDAEIAGQNLTVFDGAGRPVAEAFRSYGMEKWRTTTVYDGERTTVLPPRGSAATTVVSVRGQTAQSIQYRGPTASGDTDTTRYAYDKAGRLTSVTDPAGTVWRYHYDLRGRLIRSEDPDKGTTDLAYNDVGDVTSTTDGRGQTLAYAYDRLGRLIRTHEGSLTGTKRTEIVYDTLAKGYVTGSMRFQNGARYDTRVLSYGPDYQPTGTRVTVPSAEGALAGSYDFTYTHLADGSLSTMNYPAAGGLSGETLRVLYDDPLGLPQATRSNIGEYVNATTYTRFGEVEQLRHDPDGDLGTAGLIAWRTFHYEDGTRRLARSVFEKQAGPINRVSDVAYTYDTGGLIRKIADSADGSGDSQCFDYDHRNRLTEAWTPTSGDCAAPRSATALGGPAPYWTSWTYDTVGNRKTETSHAATGVNTTKEYTYPAPTAARPHTVTSVKITDGAGTRTLNYGYDPAGNTTSRAGPSGAVQALTWDIEGQLAKVVEGGDNTEFVYDAAGNRLLRKDATGTTLFLGPMEVRLDKATGAKTATRYYSHAGILVAVRTTGGLSWLCGDHHGSATVTMDAATQTVQRRRFTPFGEARGAAPGSWPDRKGFVGGEQDPTGLTHLGARLYDPLIGRFISADPVADPMDPQQMQGYSYANNSPVSNSDPTGLAPMTDEHWYGGKGASATPDVSPKGGGGGGPSGPSGPSAPSQRDLDDANKIKNKSKLAVIIEAGGEILKEILGINDIRDCVTKGDLMACAMTVANVIPWGKIFKLPKIIKAFKKAYDAVMAFGEKLKWANNVLRRADEAAAAAASAAAKTADDAAAAAAGGAKAADDAAGAAAGGAKAADDAGKAAGGRRAREAVSDTADDGPHVAMGLTDINIEGLRVPRALERFARQVNATTWRDPQFSDIFSRPGPTNEADFIDRIVGQNGRISFNMQGILNVEGMVAGRMNRYRTGAELHHICKSAAARAITTFLNGPAPC
jgi:RHS repeat-associated protein